MQALVYIQTRENSYSILFGMSHPGNTSSSSSRQNYQYQRLVETNDDMQQHEMVDVGGTSTSAAAATATIPATVKMTKILACEIKVPFHCYLSFYFWYL